MFHCRAMSPLLLGAGGEKKLPIKRLGKPPLEVGGGCTLAVCLIAALVNGGKNGSNSSDGPANGKPKWRNDLVNSFFWNSKWEMKK